MLERAVGLQPDDVEAWHQLAVVSIARGDRQAAANQLSILLQIEPDNAEAQIDLAVLMLSDQQNQAALELLEQARTSAPDDPRGHYYYGAALAQLGHSDAAQQIMTALAERDPEHKYGQWARRFLDEQAKE